MKIRYVTNTDALLIEPRDSPVAETRDLDKNTVPGVDAQGDICFVTVEHSFSARWCAAVLMRTSCSITLSVNRTARKLRLQVPSALCAPAAGSLKC